MEKDNVTNNIREYMNSRTSKQFSYIEVSTILNCIHLEYEDRRENGPIINTRTKEGKLNLNKKIAAMSNEKLGKQSITADDVHLLKKCRADEYTDRTGRCAYGYKELRNRLGYNPETGFEL